GRAALRGLPEGRWRWPQAVHRADLRQRRESTRGRRASMSRGPTFWIVVLAIAAASTGLYLEHRRLNPPPPQGVTVSDVGELPPPATFLTVEGKPRQLSDWRGKRLLINFWATWCAPCRREMPLLSENAGRYKARNVAIL